MGSRSKVATNSTMANPNWERRSSTPMPRPASWNTDGLHAGSDLGATPRVDSPRAAADGGENPRNRLEIRRVLLDRAFFNGAVVAFLQEEKLPFVMPVVIRDVLRKRHEADRPSLIKRQPAGWYPHVMKHEKQLLKISVCVGYRRHRNRKDGSSGIRSCCSRRGAYVVRHRNPRTVPSAIRIESSFAKCDRRESTPARGISAAAVFSGRSVDSAEPLGVDHHTCLADGSATP